MNAVLEWVKANVFIVVFAVLMLAAAVTLPIMSSGMNEKVRNDVKARAENLSKLSQLEKGEILPGQTGVPNEATLARYQEIARTVADDATKVRNAAIEHNRKGRTVLIPTLFPEPPARDLDVLPQQFHRQLMDAYGNLLTEVKAGSPPSVDSMRQELDLTRKQFITQDLKKDTNEKLTDEETARLRERLSGRRVALCLEASNNIGMYLWLDQLGVPGWDQSRQPSLGELYNWQWQYWVISDVLRALHEANRADNFVRTAPVKEVRSLTVVGLPTPTDASQSAGGPGSGGGERLSVGGFGGAGAMDSGGGGAPADGAAPAGGATLDPKAAAPKNYRFSLTGRQTNPLYDVIEVDLELVVETARLPQVLDALAKYNFMTVTSMTVNKANAFEALQQGYFYGPEPVCTVTMTLETIWLREWTQQFMPASVKKALGIALPMAPAGEGAPTT